MSRYWDDETNSYIDVEPVWNGTLCRQDLDRYSLLGDGWMQKEPVLGQYKWELEKGTYVSQGEAKKAKAADPFILTANSGPAYVGPCSTCGKQVIGERKCAHCRRKSGSHAASTGRPRPNCACGRPCSKGARRCKACVAAKRSMRRAAA